MILELIEEAVTAGARRHRACEVAGLDTRTVERWRQRPDGDDLRRGPKTRPANALTAAEEAKIVAELIAVQGKPVDIGGYYQPDMGKLSAAMRPSQTLNDALAALG